MVKTKLILLIVLLFFSAIPCHGRDQIKVGVLADTPPVSFIRENSIELRGIGVDVAVLLFKLMKVEPVFSAADTLSLTYSLTGRKIDVACMLFYSPELTERFATLDVNISTKRRIFINKSCKTVTCRKDMRGEKVVIVQGDSYEQELIGDDTIEIIYARSPLEALDLLESGESRVYVAQSEIVVRYLIQKHDLKQIAMVGMVIEEIPLVLVARHEDSELIKQLEIAYGKLSEKGSLEVIQNKWLGQVLNQSGLKRYTKYLVWSVLLSVLCFVSISVWSYLLKQKVESVTKDLKKSELRYRDLIESSPDMIFLVTEDGEILHVNESAKSKLAIPATDSALSLGKLISTENHHEMVEFLKKVFSGGWDSHQFIFMLPGDEKMEVEIAGRPINENHGVENHACLFARDVTRRNRMENEWIQTERLATIGKMAASVAHEINNPLSIILANSDELLYEESQSESVKEGLEAIQRNATRAGKITQGLLDLASPQPFEEEFLDLKELVLECAAFLKPKLKKYQFEVHFPEKSIQVKGDHRSLQQMIVNLLLNSIANMNEGGKITVTGSIESSITRIVVEDTGIGIPEEDLDRIFEPFFTSRKNGFGLGLFISRRIIEKHRGRIFAESEQCNGTRIVIELGVLETERNSHV